MTDDLADLAHLEGVLQRGWLRTVDRRRTTFTPLLIRLLWLRDPDGPLVARLLLDEPLHLLEGLEFWNLVPDWPRPVYVRQQVPLRSSPPGWLIHLVPTTAGSRS